MPDPLVQTFSVLKEYQQVRSQPPEQASSCGKYVLYVGPDETLGGEIRQKQGFSLIRMIKQLFSNHAYKAKTVAAKLNQTFIHLEESLDDPSTIQFVLDYDAIYAGLSRLNDGLSRSSGEKDILHEALQSAKIIHKKYLFLLLANARNSEERAYLLEANYKADHLKDKKYRLEIAIYLAGTHPEFFLTHMGKFSLSSKEEILQIGSRIPEEHQKNYQEKFKDLITLEELTKARITYRVEVELYSDKVFEKGVCLGHTISHIHRSSHTSNDMYSEITADARYIQAAVKMERASKDNQKTEELGRAILKQAIQDEFNNPFPQILSSAAKRLGMQGPQELLQHYIQNEYPSFVDRIVGKFAFDLSNTKTDRADQTDQNSSQKIEEFIHSPKVLDEEELRNVQAIRLRNPKRTFSNIPPTILKKRHLEQGETYFSKINMGELSSSLKKLHKEGIQGHFELRIEADERKHAIAVSIDSLSYCDINDRNPITLKPIIRRFKTIEEMTESLSTHLAITYPSYKKASLTHYKHIPTGWSLSSILKAIDKWLQKDLF